MIAAEWIVRVVALYAGFGVAFAVPFVLWGVQRIDPGAQGSHPLFRLFIAPGVAALWPVLLPKWVRAIRDPHEPGGHA